MRADEFGFRPSSAAVTRAQETVAAVGASDRLHIVTGVEGVHDELLIDPVKTLKRVLRAVRIKQSNPDSNPSHFWHPSFEE